MMRRIGPFPAVVDLHQYRLYRLHYFFELMRNPVAGIPAALAKGLHMDL